MADSPLWFIAYLTNTIAINAEIVKAIPTIFDIVYQRMMTPNNETYAITWHRADAKFNFDIISSLNLPLFSSKNV